MTSKDFALKISAIIADKKAYDISILDLRKFGAPADFFVIATALSEPHLKAIADALENELRKVGAICSHRDGGHGTEWLVLDFFDCIVHLFSKARRSYYNIEKLYGDAEQLAYELKVDMPEQIEIKKIKAKKSVKKVKKVKSVKSIKKMVRKKK